MNPSKSPGALYIYHYANTSPTEESEMKLLEIDGLDEFKQANFNPLGLAFDRGTRRLYLVNHGPPNPWIDILELSPDASKLTYIKELRGGLVTVPNSIQTMGNHKIYFTNSVRYSQHQNPVLGPAETFLRIAKGNVVYMDTETEDTSVVANVHFANGVARLNDTHLAVAATITPHIHVFEIQPDHSLRETKKLRCDFHVDNLKVDGEGKLIVAGHPYFPTFDAVMKTQHEFDLEKGDSVDRPRAGSWVAEWDGNAEGVLKKLYVDDGMEYGTSTSGVRDAKRDVGFVVGLYDRGILQYQV